MASFQHIRCPKCGFQRDTVHHADVRIGGPSRATADRMNAFVRVVLLLLVFVPIAQAEEAVSASEMRPETTYTGACDASAAMALGCGTFIVASDEPDRGPVNRLHLYRRGDNKPIGALDLTAALQHKDLKTNGVREEIEADIEAAARIGDRIYWIASHGRSGKGEQLDRHRFFATDVLADGSLALAGTPNVLPAYDRLFEDLLADQRFAPLKLSTLEKLSPDEGGFNIEGLAATGTRSLMIGLRSPLDAEGHAVLIPLEAADDLITGKAAKARFGDPIHLDLGRRGIRDIVFWPERGTYLILAGSVDDTPRFALYGWSPATVPALIMDSKAFDGFFPETMIFTAATGQLLLLSDDGDVPMPVEGSGGATKKNKKFETASRTFRSKSVTLTVK